MKMKTVFLVVAAVMLTTMSRAQTAPQSGGISTILADKKACYDQARAYVADENRDATPTVPTESWAKMAYTLEQDHYDAGTQTCYVWMTGMKDVFPPDSSNGRVVVVQATVADAFEGKEIADYTATISADGTWSNFTGQVNGEKCNDKAQWNGLLWKLIPAFQPVECYTEENGKRVPCSKPKN